LLDKVLGFQAQVVFVADDDVVEDFDAHQLAGFG
jgi:hypothetical protein